jgi:hypothetical protein
LRSNSRWLRSTTIKSWSSRFAAGNPFLTTVAKTQCSLEFRSAAGVNTDFLFFSPVSQHTFEATDDAVNDDASVEQRT